MCGYKANMKKGRKVNMELKRTWKKAISFMLALVMAFSFVPSIPARAAGSLIIVNPASTSVVYGGSGSESTDVAFTLVNSNGLGTVTVTNEDGTELTGLTYQLTNIDANQKGLVVTVPATLGVGTYSFKITDSNADAPETRSITVTAKPITIRVSDFDRAAPRGPGNVKAGLNYAMSLHPIMIAHREGFAENLYLDAATRTRVEETGGANFLFITKDGTVVTPRSDSILPSVTRRSLMYVAEHYLGLKTEERPVYFDEVQDFAECGLCGTAAVISPVGKINDHGHEICFPSGMEKMGPVIQKLYDTLTGIQMGRIEAPEGWIPVIK